MKPIGRPSGDLFESPVVKKKQPRPLPTAVKESTPSTPVKGINEKSGALDWLNCEIDQLHESPCTKNKDHILLEAVTLVSQLKLKDLNSRIDTKLEDHKAFTEWAGENFKKSEYPTQEMVS